MQEPLLRRRGKELVAGREGLRDQRLHRIARRQARAHRLGLPPGPLRHGLERERRRLHPQPAQRTGRLQHRLGLGQRTYRHIGMETFEQHPGSGLVGRGQQPRRPVPVPVRERRGLGRRTRPGRRQVGRRGGGRGGADECHQTPAGAPQQQPLHCESALGDGRLQELRQCVEPAVVGLPDALAERPYQPCRRFESHAPVVLSPCCVRPAAASQVCGPQRALAGRPPCRPLPPP